MRAGINAFTLMEKELKSTNIPLSEEVILRTLRVNTIITQLCIVDKQDYV
jgi:hypothetical protein